MAEPNPNVDEDLYKSIIIGGMFSPGQVTLSGHDRKIDWDVKAASGQQGASTTLKGIPLIEFTAAFYLADDEDFNAWPAFQAHVESTINGAAPVAMDCYHPDLAANKITSVVLSHMGGVVHDKKGGQTITVKFQEYKPPKPKGGSPNGSKAKKTAAPDPNAAANAELAALTEEYKNTPWTKP